MKSFFIICLLIFATNIYAGGCRQSQYEYGNAYRKATWSNASTSVDIYNEKCGANMLHYSLANDKEGMYQTLMQDIDAVDSGMTKLEKTERLFEIEKQYWRDLDQECGTGSEINNHIEKINEWAENIGLTSGGFMTQYKKCQGQLLHYKKRLLELIANGGNDDFVQGAYYGETESGGSCEAKVDQYNMVIYKPGTKSKMETLILDTSKINASYIQKFRTDSGKYYIRFSTDRNGRKVPYSLIYKSKKGADIRSFRCNLINI